jgi:hypothetical protein
MSPHFRPASVAAMWLAGHTCLRRCVLLVATALVVHGCTASPWPLTGPDPADPDVRVPATAYRPALRDFRGAKPNEPAPWTGGAPVSGSKKDQP